MTQVQGLQELVDGLADRLQRSVAIDDRAIRLVVASRHFGDEDPIRVQSVMGREVPPLVRDKVRALGIERLEAAGRVGELGLGLKPRICVPIRCGGLLFGYLWLIDDERLSPADIADATAVAETAGLIMYRADLALTRQEVRAEALLRNLLSADESARRRAERDLQEDGLLRAHSSATVLVLDLLPGEASVADEEAAEASLLKFARQVQTAYRGSAVALVYRERLAVFVAGRDERGTAELARHLVRDLSVMVRRRCVAGVGSTVHALHSVHVSHEQAVLAARAAQYVTEVDDVVRWDDLGVYALLARLSPNEIDPATYPAGFVRLVGAKNATMFLRTAEEFLDRAGDASATADALHVHRTTLYQRLSRIEALSGLDLRSGRDRLTLHLSIKLAKLTGLWDNVHRHPS